MCGKQGRRRDHLKNNKVVWRKEKVFVGRKQGIPQPCKPDQAHGKKKNTQPTTRDVGREKRKCPNAGKGEEWALVQEVGTSMVGGKRSPQVKGN